MSTKPRPGSTNTPRRIGIVGTFDVSNYGDLLFPLLAEAELEQRLGPIELVRFSHRPMDEPSWFFSVKGVDALGDELRTLDLLIVGGGHLIRFDKSIARDYGATSSLIHHPTGYWLGPTLAAAIQGVPVAWNALGASQDTPDWATGLLRAGINAAGYISVRDADSATELITTAPGTDIRVVPDTAFNVDRLWSESVQAESHALLQSMGVGEKYVVVQTSPHFAALTDVLVPALNELRHIGYDIVRLPISPVLGDSTDILDLPSLPSASPPSWPHPLIISRLIAGADAVLARSLHLSITALVNGAPVFRVKSESRSKYSVLEGMQDVYLFDDQTDVRPLLLEHVGRSAPGVDVLERKAQLGTHWDAICKLVDSVGQDDPDRASRRLRPLIQLPEELERLGGSYIYAAEMLEKARASREELSQKTEKLVHEIDELSARSRAITTNYQRAEARVRSWEREVESKYYEIIHRYGTLASGSETLERMADELAADLALILQSRRWKLGNLLGTVLTFWKVRSRNEGAHRRIEALVETLREREDARPPGLVTPDSTDPSSVSRLMMYANALGRLEQQRGEILSWLDSAVGEYRLLIGSRRWLLGDNVGRFTERLTRRTSKDPATARIDLLIDAFERESWRLTPITRVRERSKTANDATTEIERLYQSYVAEVEPSVLAAFGTAARGTSLRVVVRTQQDGARLSSTGGVVGLTLDAAESWPLIAKDLDSWAEEFLIVIEDGDSVSEHLVGALANADASSGQPLPSAYVVDHDWLDNSGTRNRPEFKPGFSPDLLLEHDYVSRAVVFRRRALADDGLLQAVSAQEDPSVVAREALLRLWESGHVIGKIDAVLVHLAETAPGSHRVPSDDTAYARKVLSRRGSAALVSSLASGPQVRYIPPGHPLVSIVIPFRDQAEFLRRAVESITRLTTYPSYEILLVNNQSVEPETFALLETLVTDSRVRIVDFSEPFNYSRANNQAVGQAHGDFLVFLNNDVQIISAGWLEELVGFAAQPGVGAVGGLLYYGDGTIQHAGVVIGMQGLAGHLFAGELPIFLPQSWVRHVRNVSAVTGACMCMSREVFDEVGGFDEGFQLTGSDVEICLRLLKAGRRNVVVPSVELFHYEKQTRGSRGVPWGDITRSLDKYQPYLESGDPFWNRNLALDSNRTLPRQWPEPGEEVFGTSSDATPARVTLPGQNLLRMYDASSNDLERNAALMASFQERRDIDLGTVMWFLPRFDHVFRGGIYTIMRFADLFSERSGALNHFVVMGGSATPETAMQDSIRGAFPNMKWEMSEISTPEEAADLPESDIGICTLWTTAYALLKYNKCRGKFYLVQDFEPAFFPANSLYGLVEETYRFGFVGLVNTPGVAEAYRSYGSPGEYFVPGVDTTIFHPADQRRSGPARIVFYGRPSNPRNGFELGVEALTRVKERYGDAVSIVTAGGTYATDDLGVEGVIENLGVLPTIGAVADLYRNSDIGVVFMFTKHPSYQPLEYMASGCATVTNFNEANLWLLRDGENAVLSQPTVSAVTESLSRLIEDEALRSQISRGGLETVKRLDWDAELDRMFRYVSTGEGRHG
jgi:GT2 family glycosyltransferase